MAKPKRKITGEGVVQVPETKEQKMTRLGTARVSRALTAIRLIGNLHAYKPTAPQVDKIMEALGEACSKVEARLRGARSESYTFTLK